MNNQPISKCKLAPWTVRGSLPQVVNFWPSLQVKGGVIAAPDQGIELKPAKRCAWITLDAGYGTGRAVMFRNGERLELAHGTPCWVGLRDTLTIAQSPSDRTSVAFLHWTDEPMILPQPTWRSVTLQLSSNTADFDVMSILVQLDQDADPATLSSATMNVRGDNIGSQLLVAEWFDDGVFVQVGAAKAGTAITGGAQVIPVTSTSPGNVVIIGLDVAAGPSNAFFRITWRSR